MSSRLIAACLLCMVMQGCTSYQTIHGPPNWYGTYPDIALLPESQARPVVITKGFKRPSDLSQEDLNEVVRIISRIPDSLLLTEREVVYVWCSFPFQVVAIQVQLGYNTVLVFIKPNPSEWKLVGFYHYDT
jgi:hypothetical protein